MVSFKYALILLRYYSTDTVFLSPLPYVQYNYYYKNYLILMVYNNLLLHTQKDS